MIWFLRKKPPQFSGYIDGLIDGELHGWAYDRVRPRKRLKLEVYCGGALAGYATADAFRSDLADCGFGDGRHAFLFKNLPQDALKDTIAVKVAQRDFWLGNEALHDASEALHLMNSTRRGLPNLYAGLSAHSVDARDIEIAAELLQEWRRHIGVDSAGEFVNSKTMWGDIVSARHQTLLGLLNGQDPQALAAFMVNIQKSSVSEGLTQGANAYHDFVAASPEGRRAAVLPFHDMLASLAQYLALDHAECAEQGFEGAAMVSSPETLATRIESALGHSILPPAVYDGLYGLAINGRILHGRDIQALYAALRSIEASEKPHPHICEIGGGFGKVAYYAWMRGVRHYSIVDLPSVAAIQYFYLRRALPDAAVYFVRPSDPELPSEGIHLFFASHMTQGVILPSDIVLNCDSFPEMGDRICRDYFALMRHWAPLLLSINQEANRETSGPDDRQTVVGEHLPQYGYTRRYRFRNWIRKGFIEELWSAAPSQLRKS